MCRKMETTFEAVQMKEGNGKIPTFKIEAGKTPYEDQQPSTSTLQRPSTGILDRLMPIRLRSSLSNNTPKYTTKRQR